METNVKNDTGNTRKNVINEKGLNTNEIATDLNSSVSCTRVFKRKHGEEKELLIITKTKKIFQKTHEIRDIILDSISSNKSFTFRGIKRVPNDSGHIRSISWISSIIKAEVILRKRIRKHRMRGTARPTLITGTIFAE